MIQDRERCETRVYHVPFTYKCIYGSSNEGCRNGDEREGSEISGGGRGVRFLEEGRKWRLSGLLHADDSVLCGELEKNRGQWWNIL